MSTATVTKPEFGLDPISENPVRKRTPSPENARLYRPVECLNLNHRFGKRYKIGWDECHQRRDKDPWLMQIPCEHGHIYPHGGEILGFASDKRGGIAKSLASQPYATVAQDGADGMNILFNVTHFANVVKIVKPKRRRRLSPQARENLIADGERFRFSRGAEDAKTALECVQI